MADKALGFFICLYNEELTSYKINNILGIPLFLLLLIPIKRKS